METEHDENGIPVYDVEIDLEDDELIREQTLSILKSLKPDWDLKNLNFETFTNGITNRIYAVFSEEDDNANREKLIFRVFGRNTDKIISSKMSLAAPIYAKFRNGIICGYLEGKCLDVKSVRETTIVKAVCKAMAHMHKIPIDSKSTAFASKTQDFLDNLPSSYQTEELQKRFDNY